MSHFISVVIVNAVKRVKTNALLMISANIKPLQLLPRYTEKHTSASVHTQAQVSLPSRCTVSGGWVKPKSRKIQDKRNISRSCKNKLAENAAGKWERQQLKPAIQRRSGKQVGTNQLEISSR